MKKSFHYTIRKSHRYLGLLTGIQFLFWTLGGLYFSWSDIDEIHGDYERKASSYFQKDVLLVSPSDVISQLAGVDSVKSVRLINILGEAVYQISYFTAANPTAAGGHSHAAQEQTQLASARSGNLRAAVTEREAIRMAQASFNAPAKITGVAYLTAENINGHHEYRGSPLPAWAVTMDHPTATTVYVAAERGEVLKFRNDKWRTFDFLWMLHTMDYQGRDNFGNILLRIFSVVGLITIVSGLFLYYISSATRRRVARKAKRHQKALAP